MAEARSGSGNRTVLRMILGRQLQGLREKAGLSYEQASSLLRELQRPANGRRTVNEPAL